MIYIDVVDSFEWDISFSSCYNSFSDGEKFPFHVVEVPFVEHVVVDEFKGKYDYSKDEIFLQRIDSVIEVDYQEKC